jgi:hypothetical protein
MNWLFYIGGYGLFSSILNIMDGIEYKILYGENKLKKESIRIMIPEMITHILLWIWICKRFL